MFRFRLVTNLLINHYNSTADNHYYSVVILRNSPFCHHQKFPFAVISSFLHSCSISLLIFFYSRTPLSASNLPQLITHSWCILISADFLSTFPWSVDLLKTAHTHPIGLYFLLHYHWPSAPHCDTFSVFLREMMEISDQGDSLVNQWVTTHVLRFCLTLTNCRGLKSFCYMLVDRIWWIISAFQMFIFI